MTKSSFTLIAILGLGLAACGGDDGPADSTPVTQLSAEEAKDFCVELAGDLPQRTITCGEELTIQVGFDAAECATEALFDAECTATVGNARACVEALAGLSDAMWCTMEQLPPACAPVADC